MYQASASMGRDQRAMAVCGLMLGGRREKKGQTVRLFEELLGGSANVSSVLLVRRPHRCWAPSLSGCSVLGTVVESFASLGRPHRRWAHRPEVPMLPGGLTWRACCCPPNELSAVVICLSSTTRLPKLLVTGQHQVLVLVMSW
jgi:hypothetical protein